MTRAGEVITEDTRKDAAVDWFVRRSTGPLPLNEEEAFQAWLSQSPENRATYVAMERIWSVTAEIEDDPHVGVRRQAVVKAVERTRRTRRAFVAGLATVVVAVAGVGLYGLSGPKPLADQSFRTAIGQQATVTLPDGSIVTLNTDTVVRTREDRERRLVYLEKGQAFFKVAKDPRHPFVVSAAGRTVTALGTAFDVRMDRGELKVVLVEGKVRVETVAPATPQRAGPAEAKPPAQATEMSAGTQLVVSDDADWRLMRTDVARETSWLQGQIVFDDEALRDIVAELNRYSTRKIVIADESLARERLSGIYKPGDLDSFSRALRAYGVAEVKEEMGGELQIVALK